jgi:hypothetical protein
MWFIAALVGAMAMAAGIIGIVSPFESGTASSSPPAAPPSAVDGLLAEMAPGATIEKQADGSVSVSGRLSAAVLAEVNRAKQLAAVYPASIRCSGAADAAMQCAEIQGSDLDAALKAGDSGLYLRIVRRGITQDAIDRSTPMFAAAELACREPDTTATLSCTHVDRAQPVIAASETLFVSYTPYNVTFDAAGHMVDHLTAPLVIPLVRGN